MEQLLKPCEYQNLVLFSPSGALLDEVAFDRGIQQLQQLGYATHSLPQARFRQQRFAGSDLERIQAIEEAVNITTEPSVLMASRGGYGLSRLLSQLKLPKLLDILCNKSHILCGHSDFTALQLALLAQYEGTMKRKTPHALRMLHGPMVCFDFGSEQGVDPETMLYFNQAIQKNTVDVAWKSVRSAPPWAPKNVSGPAWGGNLVMLCSLLGTPYFPMIKGGILILEDVNEPVYKIERMLLQLLYSGVLQQQAAIVMGNFNEPPPIAYDDGYNLASAVACLQEGISVPILMDFPFGHCTPKACWFQGQTAQLTIQMADDSTLHCMLQQRLR